MLLATGKKKLRPNEFGIGLDIVTNIIFIFVGRIFTLNFYFLKFKKISFYELKIF
jgi:hypothetical protein